MQDVELDINFDVSIDQMTKLLWVLKDNPTTRDGAAMYEKVLRDEWDKLRRDAAIVVEGPDGIAELAEDQLQGMLETMEEIKTFIIKSVDVL